MSHDRGQAMTMVKDQQAVAVVEDQQAVVEDQQAVVEDQQDMALIEDQ